MAKIKRMLNILEQLVTDEENRRALIHEVTSEALEEYTPEELKIIREICKAVVDQIDTRSA